MLAEGTLVGEFRIRGLLGEGAMGQVYLAQDILLGRSVALKLIKRSVIQNHGAARFLEEARATASFNHPHIVTLYAVGEHDGRPYLALEYLDGESLRARLAAGPLTMRDALRCCRAVAEAIAEAHRRGLVHADLKPENIVIPRDGRVRVVDFGLARLVQGAPGAASGTPAYMAPERWRGLPPTGAIDIWALGITLHELVTARRPIADAALLPFAFARGDLELTGLPSEPWAQLVRDCLVLDPDERPTAEVVVRRITLLLDPAAVATDTNEHANPVYATHAQYLTTQLAADVDLEHETYVRYPRLTFSVRNAGAPSDEWLVPVVECMVRRVLRECHDRRFHLVDGGDDATRIELVFIRTNEQIRIDALNRVDVQALASATAISVASAVYALADALADKVGIGLPLVGPDAAELDEMRHTGAASVELLRRYRQVLHAHFATSLPDLHQLAITTHELIADDLEWAHAYALLAVIQGIATDDARDTLATARAMANAARDPAGMQLLDALAMGARGEPESAFQIAGELYRQSDDLLTGVLLANWAMLSRRTEEALVTVQHLHAKFPEFFFGREVAEWLRQEARDQDADRVLREWVAAAPDNLPARVELIRIEANAGRLDEARAKTRELVAIHGDQGDALAELFEAFVASDQITGARGIADQMLAGSPPVRAQGRYRIAMTSVFEGRFAAAYDAVRRAIIEHRAFAMQSELTQCLELARSIAPLVSDLQAQRRYTEELAGVFATMIGDDGLAAATRFELALLADGGGAPSIEDHLAGLEDGPRRDMARRRMLRTAALAGCGSLDEAVAAGFSAVEENTASLLALGLCAWRVGELALARRSLERATRRWSSIAGNQSSPYHAVLARFHLAGVLTELGEHTAARASYEAFLRCWANTDRPVPEVAVARRMLELNGNAEP